MTPAQATTATLDELRDWLAEADGWRRDTEIAGPQSPHWYRYPNGMSWGVRHFGPHPHPPTLDGAAAALPERWDLHLVHPDKRGWHAAAKAGPWFDWRYVSTDEAPDELTARYRLAVLCRLAEKGVAK